MTASTYYVLGRSGPRVNPFCLGFVTERQLRDKIVIGTKFTATTDASNPNASAGDRLHRPVLDALLEDRHTR